MSPFVFSGQESSGIVVERHITISAAAAVTGYNPQYSRRLLRQKRLKGKRLGQQWLSFFVSKASVIFSARLGLTGLACSLVITPN